MGGYKRAGRVVVVAGVVLAWELARYILAGLTIWTRSETCSSKVNGESKAEWVTSGAGRVVVVVGLVLARELVARNWLDNMDKDLHLEQR